MKKLLPILALVALVAALSAAPANAAAPTHQRVIVELALPANAAADQIAATTNNVLALLPAGSFTVNNRYANLPYVALTAGPTALTVLRATGLVSAVYADGTVHASATATAKKSKCKSSKQHHRKKSKKTCK